MLIFGSLPHLGLAKWVGTIPIATDDTALDIPPPLELPFLP